MTSNIFIFFQDLSIFQSKCTKNIPNTSNISNFPFFQGLNLRLSFAIAAGAFGSAFQHGYNTGVLNAPQALITAWIGDNECQVNATTGANATRPDFNPSDATVSDSARCEVDEARVTLIWAWIVAIFCVGGMIGGTSCGFVASRLGR